MNIDLNRLKRIMPFLYPDDTIYFSYYNNFNWEKSVFHIVVVKHVLSIINIVKLVMYIIAPYI